MKTATFLRTTRSNKINLQSVYMCKPPLDGHKYVLVSAVDEKLGFYRVYETYIFGCDKNGEVLDWAELHGSLKDTFSHKEALENAGYVIVARTERGRNNTISLKQYRKNIKSLR